MDYQTKTPLILPFRYELMVSNGGRTLETNNHQRPGGPKNQVFGYDFRTKTSGNETKLEDYPVFGQPVISPGNGIVVQVIDGSIDCNPGLSDRSVGVGNAIIIDFGNSEYGVLCHLKHRTICVRVGDTVRQGDIVGSCGNTGNTSQPHIHFHLQDGPLMHVANGLPLQFRAILIDGAAVKNAEPLRFQMVSNL